jgi:hypothetical protein
MKSRTETPRVAKVVIPSVPVLIRFKRYGR